MIAGRKRYCDKCGQEIEHDFYHSIEWEDLYVHRQDRKHKHADVCNRCYAEAFHTFFQCGSDVENKEESIPSSGAGEPQPAVIRYLNTYC